MAVSVGTHHEGVMGAMCYAARRGTTSSWVGGIETPCEVAPGETPVKRWDRIP